MTERRAVSVKGAAALYDVSEDSIRKAINARQLAAKKIGRALRIDTDALAAWFDSLEDASPAAGEES